MKICKIMSNNSVKQQNFGNVTLMGEKYGEASIAKFEKALSPTLDKSTVIEIIKNIARDGGSYSADDFYRHSIKDSINISVVDQDKLMVTNNSSSKSPKFLLNIEPLTPNLNHRLSNYILNNKLNRAIHFVITGK